MQIFQISGRKGEVAGVGVGGAAQPGLKTGVETRWIEVLTQENLGSFFSMAPRQLRCHMMVSRGQCRQRITGSEGLSAPPRGSWEELMKPETAAACTGPEDSPPLSSLFGVLSLLRVSHAFLLPCILCSGLGPHSSPFTSGKHAKVRCVLGSSEIFSESRSS